MGLRLATHTNNLPVLRREIDFFLFARPSLTVSFSFLLGAHTHIPFGINDFLTSSFQSLSPQSLFLVCFALRTIVAGQQKKLYRLVAGKECIDIFG